MAYHKDLGQVKGDQGNFFDPEVTVERNKIKFTWVEKTADGTITEQTKTMFIDIPIYVPVITEVTDDNSLETEQLLSFVQANAADIVTLPSVNIKGEKGDPGEMKIRIAYVNSLEALLDNPSGIREDTLYVTNDTNYVYFIDVDNSGDEPVYTPIKLEGINLDNYYTKLQTYSREDIDAMFKETAAYMALMYQLLDVSEPDNLNEAFSDEPEEPDLEMP